VSGTVTYRKTTPIINIEEVEIKLSRFFLFLSSSNSDDNLKIILAGVLSFFEEVDN
jgi:hypothetical protein